MLLYDGQAVHTLAVRLFILERKHLSLSVQTIDVPNLENRRLPFRTTVSTRGEVPALRLDDGTILTETPAICQYLDAVATGGESLFGTTALDRALTTMWLRRVEIEITQPLIRWYRDDPDSVDFYRGNRLPCPEARLADKIACNQGLNLLDDHFVATGNVWVCGGEERFSVVDVFLYSMLKLMGMVAGWVEAPGRTGVAAWMKRMDEREASVESMKLFGEKIEV